MLYRIAAAAGCASAVVLLINPPSARSHPDLGLHPAGRPLAQILALAHVTVLGAGAR